VPLWQTRRHKLKRPAIQHQIRVALRRFPNQIRLLVQVKRNQVPARCPTVQSQGIEFSIDSTSHRIVVKVVDQSNNQVIRQIPSKEALAIADSLDESQGGQSTQGLLIKQQA
jgi:hypothetical protein